MGVPQVDEKGDTALLGGEYEHQRRLSSFPDPGPACVLVCKVWLKSRNGLWWGGEQWPQDAGLQWTSCRALAAHGEARSPGPCGSCRLGGVTSLPPSSCTGRWLRAPALEWDTAVSRSSSATRSLSLASASPTWLLVPGSAEFCCHNKRLPNPRGLKQRLVSCSNPMPLRGQMRALQDVFLIPCLRLGSSKAVLEIKLCMQAAYLGDDSRKCQ